MENEMISSTGQSEIQRKVGMNSRATTALLLIGLLCLGLSSCEETSQEPTRTGTLQTIFSRADFENDIRSVRLSSDGKYIVYTAMHPYSIFTYTLDGKVFSSVQYPDTNWVREFITISDRIFVVAFERSIHFDTVNYFYNQLRIFQLDGGQFKLIRSYPTIEFSPSSPMIIFPTSDGGAIALLNRMDSILHLMKFNPSWDIERDTTVLKGFPTYHNPYVTNPDGTISVFLHFHAFGSQGTDSLLLFRISPSGSFTYKKITALGSSASIARAVLWRSGDYLLSAQTDDPLKSPATLLRMRSDGDVVWRRQYDHQNKPNVVWDMLELENGDILCVGGSERYIDHVQPWIMVVSPVGDIRWSMIQPSPYVGILRDVERCGRYEFIAGGVWTRFNGLNRAWVTKFSLSPCNQLLVTQ